MIYEFKEIWDRGWKGKTEQSTSLKRRILNDFTKGLYKLEQQRSKKAKFYSFKCSWCSSKYRSFSKQRLLSANFLQENYQRLAVKMLLRIHRSQPRLQRKKRRSLKHPLLAWIKFRLNRLKRITCLYTEIEFSVRKWKDFRPKQELKWAA